MPLKLVTEVADSGPDHLDALGWTAVEGPRAVRPGFDLDAAFARLRRFKAKVGETLVIPGETGRIEVIVGLGDESSFTTAKLRQAAASFSRTTSEAKVLVLDLTGVGALVVGAGKRLRRQSRAFSVPATATRAITPARPTPSSLFASSSPPRTLRRRKAASSEASSSPRPPGSLVTFPTSPPAPSPRRGWPRWPQRSPSAQDSRRRSSTSRPSWPPASAACSESPLGQYSPPVSIKLV